MPPVTQPRATPVVWDRSRLAVLVAEGALQPLVVDGSAATLDDAIAKCGYLPHVLAGSTPVGAETKRNVDADGVAYEVFEQNMRTVNDVVEHAYLQDVSAVVWPGAVIQGAPLLNGDTTVIGLPRAPGTLSIVTDLVTDAPGRQSVKIADPSAASVGDHRRELLQKLKPRDSAGILNTQYARATTLREVGAKLGLNIHGSGYGVQLDASYDSTYKSSTVVACIRQTYYVTSFEPDGSGASGAFSASVNVADLDPFIGSGNPPLMITQVHYGRLIVVTATATLSSQELTAALKAQWDAAVSGDVSVSGRYKSVIDSSEVRVYAIGATAATSPTTLTNPVQDLDAIYRDGLAMSVSNPGAPIAFSARHVLGGSLAHVGLAAEYVQPVRAIAGDVNHEVSVWDGPDGGAVDTGIDVAPGDRVTISAGGQTWSGVWFTGTNGPEGWPNWRAGDAAPAPEENVHSLIGRFGNNDWFKVGGFWNGTNEGQSTSRLQLNINDDNPYNGDPNQRFTAKIHVVRQPAGAVGIYV